MKRLKNRNIITKLCKISGTSQTCRTGTDDSNLMSVWLSCLLRLDSILSCPIRYKTLKLTDCNRISLDSADTLALTLALLWTYTSADCRKCG